MEPITPEYTRLRAAVTERLNAHDLAGVMDHGAPVDEYAPEAEDLTALMARGEPVTPAAVAGVWHKWFGDSAGEPEPPTAGMALLAVELQNLQLAYLQG